MSNAKLATLLICAVFLATAGPLLGGSFPDSFGLLQQNKSENQRVPAPKSAETTPPFIETLTISPSQANPPDRVVGTVILYSAAPPTGTTVMLASNSNVASVPATATIPGGAKSATFAITTQSVAEDIPITITASMPGSKAVATLLLLSPNLVSVKLSTSSVTNTMAEAIVTLTGPAPAGGAHVEITTSSSAASLPKEVLIPAGANTATCPLTPQPVEEDTPVAVSATYKGLKSSATITIRTATLSSLRINPLRGAGHSKATGSLSLNGVAPASGMTVVLSSSSALVSIPARISLPPGAKSATFPITTPSVPEDTQATITASLRGIVVSASMIVEAPVLSAIRFEHGKVSRASTARGVVTLSSPAPTGGLRVVLSSGDNEVKLPGAIVVPPGSRSASFEVAFQNVTTPHIITVTAVAKTTCSARLFLQP